MLRAVCRKTRRQVRLLLSNHAPFPKGKQSPRTPSQPKLLIPRLGALPSYCENAGAGASNRFLNRNSVGDSYPASSPSVRVDSERLSGRARLRIRSNLNQAWAILLAFILSLNFPKLSGNLMRVIPCVNSFQKITPCCPSLNRDQCRVLLGHFQSPHVLCSSSVLK